MSVTSPPHTADAERASPWEQWRREASDSPPNIDDFAEMMADIRLHAALDRTEFSKLEPPDELCAALACLQAVLSFLQKQPGLMERKDLAPLLRLNGALNDLAGGKPSNLLKPARKPGGKGGNTGDNITYKFIKAIAARTLSELITAGEDINQSAGRIARALKAGRRDMGHVNAATVVNWRERFEQGPGAGAQADAMEQYRMPTPGDTPKERGENLLKALAQRGGAIG